MCLIQDIKAELLKNPDKIVELLEHFGFEHINLRQKEIRFARDSDGGQNISIRLEKNEYCSVVDFVHGTHYDIFSYIIKEKNATFREVLLETKNILGLEYNWKPKKKTCLFGGIYSNLGKPKEEVEVKTYPDSIMDQYDRIGNLRWLRDGISLETQQKFGVSYCDVSQRICLPIRNQYGDVIGVKSRVNGEPTESNPKYLYSIPCLASSTLFGYSDNYNAMYDGTVLIFEAEKSVLQLDSMGYHNAVALMSNSLSEMQAKLLLALNPKKVIFMLDNGLDLSVTKRNADMLKSVCVMKEIEICFWDWRDSLDTDDCDSPTDNGKEIFEYILENEIKNIEELESY